MKNPYNHARLKSIKRKSRLRYGVAKVVLFPKYLGWQLSRLVPDQLGRRLRSRFRFLAKPLNHLKKLYRYWILTRSWKFLLIATPLLLVLVWVFSTLFLANNRTDDELYVDYRSSLLNAVGRGEYELADFLTGKLLASGAYSRDEPVLFAAMIAAHETGNIPRRDLLLTRLTEELNSPRSHMWQASQLLQNRASDAGASQRAIEHIKKAIALSDNPDPMRIELVKIYFQQRRYQLAISMLSEIQLSDLRFDIVKAKLYYANGDLDRSYNMLIKVLEDMNNDDPEMKKYSRDRLAGLVLLVDMRRDLSYVSDATLELVKYFEEIKAFNPESSANRANLVQAYLILGRTALIANDTATKTQALIYFDKAISSGDVPYSMGKLFYSISNLDSSGGLSEQQMRAAFVKGEGGSVAHVLLGVDAWKKDLIDDTEFHLRLAHDLNPGALRLVEYVAVYIAQASSEGTLNPFRLSLSNEPLWQRSLQLLRLSSSIDASGFERNLYTQCMILSSQQRWNNIVILLEPHAEKFSEDYRRSFLGLLVKACAEAGDAEKAAKYSQILRRYREE